MTHHYDSSASGYLSDSFEGISQTFTDVETLSTSEVNVVAADRTCDVKYLGDQCFVVTASENTRLREGDTFECSLIIEGEPLYLDNLKQGELPAIAYVCGKKTGVWFEFKR